MLNLNLEANSVYLSRPLGLPHQPSQENEARIHTHEEATVVQPSDQRELAPESGKI